MSENQIESQTFVMSKKKTFGVVKFYRYSIEKKSTDGSAFLLECSMNKSGDTKIYDLSRSAISDSEGLHIEILSTASGKRVMIKAVSERNKKEFLQKVKETMPEKNFIATKNDHSLRAKAEVTLRPKIERSESSFSRSSVASGSSAFSRSSAFSSDYPESPLSEENETRQESNSSGQGSGIKRKGDTSPSFEVKEPIVFTDDDHLSVLSELPDIETFLDAVIIGSLMGDIVAANSHSARLFGFDSAQHMRGKPISSLMPEPYKSSHDGYLFRFEKSGKEKSVGHLRVLKAERTDGSVFDVKTTLAKLTKHGYFLAVFEEIK